MALWMVRGSSDSSVAVPVLGRRGATDAGVGAGPSTAGRADTDDTADLVGIWLQFGNNVDAPRTTTASWAYVVHVGTRRRAMVSQC